MPCDSPGAGMVALGAVRRDLEDKSANNSEGHFEYLNRLRNNLSEDERENNYLLDSKRKKWIFTSDDNEYGMIVRAKNGNGTATIIPAYSSSYRLHTDPPVVENNDKQKLNLEDYQLIPECSGTILQDNLSMSYSGILYIGKATGKDSIYVTEFYNIKFKNGKRVVSLGQLLTLRRSMFSPISRLNFCNLGSIDEQSQHYYLVVADGCQAFEKAINHFKASDIIGVCSRSESAESADSLVSKITAIKRFYNEVSESMNFHIRGKSIGLSILERR